MHKSAKIIYVFKPLSSCFAFVLCRIGVVDLFYYFYACVGCSMFCAHFRSGLVFRGQLQIEVGNGLSSMDQPTLARIFRGLG